LILIIVGLRGWGSCAGWRLTLELPLHERTKAQLNAASEARISQFLAELERIELGVNARFARGNVAMQFEDGILTVDELERERAERLKQLAA
jgi:hypothetical protein